MPPSLFPVLQGASDQTESRRLVTQGRRRAKRGFVPGDDRATLLCQDICLEVGDRAVEIGEGTVELGLEDGLEPRSELPGRLVAEFDEVTSHQDRSEEHTSELQSRE